ncbi:hypothetical protein TNCV_4858621 [Trichonephila clavipes]|nr:hypothetical protein TNCV_4858621 [Trichonephila clavipes]
MILLRLSRKRDEALDPDPVDPCQPGTMKDPSIAQSWYQKQVVRGVFTIKGYRGVHTTMLTCYWTSYF